MEGLRHDDLAAMLAGLDINSTVYKGIRDLEKAEKSGDPAKIKAIDFSVTPVVSLLVLHVTRSVS
jgi:hypothetical protein